MPRGQARPPLRRHQSLTLVTDDPIADGQGATVERHDIRRDFSGSHRHPQAVSCIGHDVVAVAGQRVGGKGHPADLRGHHRLDQHPHPPRRVGRGTHAVGQCDRVEDAGPAPSDRSAQRGGFANVEPGLVHTRSGTPQPIFKGGRRAYRHGGRPTPLQVSKRLTQCTIETGIERGSAHARLHLRQARRCRPLLFQPGIQQTFGATRPDVHRHAGHHALNRGHTGAGSERPGRRHGKAGSGQLGKRLGFAADLRVAARDHRFKAAQAGSRLVVGA